MHTEVWGFFLLFELMKGLNIEGFLFSFLSRDLLPAVWRASGRVTGILKCRKYNVGSKGKTRTWMLRQESSIEGEGCKNLIKHFKRDGLGCNPGEEAYPGWTVFISSVLHTDIPHSWACVYMTNDSPVSGEGAEGREDSELRGSDPVLSQLTINRLIPASLLFIWCGEEGMENSCAIP